ncbi:MULTISPECIES: hypothetical protein, partial [Variovorax]|uniref:hypothetical protein n=1 Tax=Variovorax sp. 3319 TaxID=2817754 RepID=UPI00286AD8EE
MLAVVDGARADVQGVARRDGAGLGHAVGRLGFVVERARGNGNRIAVDAAGADVVQRARVDLRG